MVEKSSKASKFSSEGATTPQPQSDSSSVSQSLFPNGSNIMITGGSFVHNIDASKVLDPLYEKVSPNAILNQGGRVDAVRCYPGTRDEVISRIENWHRADHLEGHPILWLSGPAGAGKSAIFQTVAERCIEQEIPMVNFFFFRGDATRNDATPVVATLLYQLFNLFPELKIRIMGIVAMNPVIFRHSMETQFATLIEDPLRTIQQSSGRRPPVMIIDGLDECSSELGKIEQISLLRILHNISTKINPAFTVLVASRNEHHITMTFNEIGTSPSSIYLDNSYRPCDDIRIFLNGEFARIRQTHSLRDTLDPDWPQTADIDSILDKSSGQFIYAATVVRFIANSGASPKNSLEIVLGLRPVTKISPFAILDSLYSHILSQAEDWDSVQEILGAHRLLTEPENFKLSSKPTNLPFFLVPLGYTEDDIRSHLSELPAIVQFQPGNHLLTVFHASLADFLYDASRAGKFYIDINTIASRLAASHFMQACDPASIYDSFQSLSRVKQPSRALNEGLNLYFPNADISMYKYNGYLDRLLRESNQCMDILQKLYQSEDPQLDKQFTSRWREWFDLLKNVPKVQRIGYT